MTDEDTPREGDLLERFLRWCTPEQLGRGDTPLAILAALAPDERIALLDHPDLIGALPTEVLAALPAAVLDRLEPDAREIVRARTGR